MFINEDNKDEKQTIEEWMDENFDDEMNPLEEDLEEKVVSEDDESEEEETTSSEENGEVGDDQSDEPQEDGDTSSASEDEDKSEEDSDTSKTLTPEEIERLVEEKANEKVGRIMHERTREYADKLEKYRQIGTPEQIAAALEAKNNIDAKKDEDMTDEDRELIGWIQKNIPGLDKLEKNAKMLEEIAQRNVALEQVRVEQFKSFAQECSNEVESICKSSGITDEQQIKGLEDMVAGMAQRDESALKKFGSGDKSFVKDILDGFLPSLEKRGANNKLAELSKTKKKLASTSTKGLPSGGTPDTSFKAKTMTAEEREEAAYRLINGTNMENSEVE